MKIVVLADTHIPERAKDIPQKLYTDLKTAQLILHAGDIATPEFLKKLENICTTKAVAGNMDDVELKKKLPAKQIIAAGKFRIGLIHGWGTPNNLVALVEKEFTKEKPDIIIFGHSHQTMNERRNNILFFNPGSCTDLIFAKTQTYGIININDTIDARIVNL